MLTAGEQKLDDSLDFKMVILGNKVKYHIGRLLRPLDITSEQLGILARLWEQDGLNQKELARKNLKDQANMTRILDKLVRKELVQRVTAADDRRAYLIYLTDRGKQLFQSTNPIVSQVKERVTTGMTEREIRTFSALIDRALNNLD